MTMRNVALQFAQTRSPSIAHLFTSSCKEYSNPLRTRRHAIRSTPQPESMETKEAEHIMAVLKQHKLWGPELEKALTQELGFRLTPAHMIKVLKWQPPATVALMFFRWASGQPGFRHNVNSYTLLMDILGRARKFAIVWQLLEEMKKNDILVSEAPFVVLIKNYGKAGLVQEAMDTFQHMKITEFGLSAYAYNAILNVLIQADRLEMSRHITREMWQSAISPDAATLAILLKGLCKAQKFADALELLNERCRAGNIAYNMVLDALVKVGKTDHAYDLLKDMPNRNCTPDALNYNAVLNGFSKEGRLDEAFALFLQMAHVGCTPSVVTHNIMLKVLFQQGRVDAAVNYFEKMVRNGFIPTTVTYNTIMLGLTNCDKVHHAIHLFQKMLEKEEVGEERRVSYSTILSCLHQAIEHRSRITDNKPVIIP